MPTNNDKVYTCGCGGQKFICFEGGNVVCDSCDCIMSRIKVIASLHKEANPKMYGYFESPDQPADQPTFEPPKSAPCLFCGQPITPNDVRTISLMKVGAARSYFYRTHSTCHENASEQFRNQIDQVVFDAIDHYGD